MSKQGWIAQKNKTPASVCSAGAERGSWHGRRYGGKSPEMGKWGDAVVGEMCGTEGDRKGWIDRSGTERREEAGERWIGCWEWVV